MVNIVKTLLVEGKCDSIVEFSLFSQKSIDDYVQVFLSLVPINSKYLFSRIFLTDK